MSDALPPPVDPLTAGTPPLYPPSVAPPAEPLGIIGFLRRCADNPLATIPAAAYRDLVTCLEPFGGYKVLWLADPDAVEGVLVRDAGRFRKTDLETRLFGPAIGNGILTAEGNDWRWQRRVLAPLFRHSELLGYVPEMAAAANEQIERWRRAGTTGAPQLQAIDRDMTAATYAVIVRTMLYGGTPRDVDAVMTSGSAYLEGTSWVLAYGLIGLPGWLPHPATFTLRRTARAFRSSVAAIIADRQASGKAATDLLGRLLAARDPETDQPLSRDLLVDNLATLLEAGHETTAQALTWSLYLLARLPDWQQRIREEVARVCSDRQIEPDDLDRLVLTERFIKEVMRLYPPAPILSRTPREPVVIAGHAIEPGHPVYMPIYAIHRHRKLWDDPDRFDPERFLPEREAQLKRTQYMPFGAGPRICLGASFAMLEAKTLLASFVRAARFTWNGRHNPEPVSRVTLRPRGGMPLLVELA